MLSFGNPSLEDTFSRNMDTHDSSQAVPGSSEPSGQSHELSLTRDEGIDISGWPMQVKVSLIS